MSFHGDEYKIVKPRLAQWREDHPATAGWAMVSTRAFAADRVWVQVSIISPEGITVATGDASQSTVKPCAKDWPEARDFKAAMLQYGKHCGKYAETSAQGRAMNAFGGVYMSKDIDVDPRDDTATQASTDDTGGLLSKIEENIEKRRRAQPDAPQNRAEPAASTKDSTGGVAQDVYPFRLDPPKAGDRFFSCVQEIEKLRRRMIAAGVPEKDSIAQLQPAIVKREHAYSTLQKKFRLARRIADDKIAELVAARSATDAAGAPRDAGARAKNGGKDPGWVFEPGGEARD